MRYIISSFCLSVVLLAQVETFDPELYRDLEIHAVKLENPLEIDGVLDEDLYTTTPNSPFVQYEPHNGDPASEKSEYWVGYDDNFVYLGAKLYDNQPDSIVARMGRRDSGENSDELYIVFDSYFDRRSAFWFGINPIGSISDGTVSNDNHFESTWDGIWEGKSRISEYGWSTEIKVPFSQLRFNIADEYLMGLGLARRIHRKEEMDFNYYLSREESGMVSHFPVLKGIRNINPQKRIELMPYTTGNYGFLSTENDNPFFKGSDSSINLGTDLKIGIGNNLTVDATIFPDFGQIEVDPSVINLSAFETFFEEKRPFFIEGASIFRFGRGGPTNNMSFGGMIPNFFYSRRIGRMPHYDDIDGDWIKSPTATSILGATKISGKITDNWSIGGFSALTDREYAKVRIDDENSEVEVEPLTSYNLFRTLKEFNQGQQGLGLMGTYVRRFFDDDTLQTFVSNNSVSIGIDGWVFLNQDKDWALGGWLGFTQIDGSKEYLTDLQESSRHYFQRPDADNLDFNPDLISLKGYGGRFTLNKETGRLGVNAATGFMSPGFEINDMGLNYTTNRINSHFSIGYEWTEPRKIFLFADINTAYMTNYTFDGIKLSEMVFLFGYYRFVNFWSANFIVGVGPETMSDETLRGGPLVISPASLWSRYGIRSDSRKPMIMDIHAVYWRSETGSYDLTISPGFEFSIGTRLRLEIDPQIAFSKDEAQYIDVFEDANAKEMYGKRYIVSQLDRQTFAAEFRIDYTFNPRLSFQAYVQPYMTVGAYNHFKEFTKPESYEFVEYGKDENMTIEKHDDSITLDPTGGGDEDAFSFDDPDFSYKALVGSAVLRWEFRPGSTLYLVWTRNGSDEQNPGDFSFGRDLSDMFSAPSDNIFAVKVSYWLSR
jgi:hypothetical protein